MVKKKALDKSKLCDKNAIYTIQLVNEFYN